MRKFTKQVTIPLTAIGILWIGSITAFGAQDVKINEENFPNKQFYEWVSEKADKDSDGVLSQKEIEAVIKMDLSNKKINTLEGIEYFEKLQVLSCADNDLSKLDLSQNQELTSLDCSGNSLKSLNVSQCTKLKLLNCEDNNLNKLNVSNNQELTDLYCGKNKLVKLNITKNIKLESLKCENNELISLDLADHKNLNNLECNGNQLMSLNLDALGLDIGESAQKQSASTMAYYEDGKWKLDMTSLVGEENKGRVKVTSGGTYKEKEGVVICEDKADSITYQYAMKKGSTDVKDQMEVKVALIKTENLSVQYQTRVRKQGWKDSVTDGQTSGTVGKNLSIQGLKISLNNEIIKGGISYRVYMQDTGWQDWMSDGKLAGTENKDRRIEGVEMKLTGEVEKNYDIYYRTHVQDIGWLGWVKNGESSGSKDLELRAEAVEICLVKKGEAAPGNDKNGFITPKKLDVSGIQYSIYTKDEKWQKEVKGGNVAGDTDSKQSIEAIKVKVPDSILTRSIQYRTHIENIGWLDWSSDGAISGSTRQGLCMEAIEMKLEKELEKKYDIYYCTFIEGDGWQDWVKNGKTAGTSGKGKGIKAIEVQLVKKGQAAPEKKA